MNARTHITEDTIAAIERRSQQDIVTWSGDVLKLIEELRRVQGDKTEALQIISKLQNHSAAVAGEVLCKSLDHMNTFEHVEKLVEEVKRLRGIVAAMKKYKVGGLDRSNEYDNGYQDGIDDMKSELRRLLKGEQS